MKWLNILSGLLFIPLFAVLLGGSYASAVSDYDDLIQLTDNLVLVNSADPTNESKNVDLTLRWYTESLEALDNRCTVQDGNWCDVYDFWLDFNFAEDHFIVKKSPDSTVIEIVATNDPNAYMQFYDMYPDRRLLSHSSAGYTTIRFSIINSDNSSYDNIATEDNIVIISREIYTNNTNMSVTSDAHPYLIFLSTLDLVLPPGYEGEIPPETYQPPTEDVPGVRYYIKFSYDVSLAEGIKLTNEIPEDLTDNLPSGIWQCYFLITNDVENYETEGIDQDIYHLNSCEDRTQIIHHPPVELGKVYLVELVLQNRIYQNDRLSASQRLEVTLNPYSGDTEVGDDRNALEQCITDEAPYIDIFGCFDTLKYVINILSFGTFDFTGMFSWTFQPSCRELTVFDRWMNLEGENRILCPMFNKEVRDTITPFVTIVFGTTILVMVVRTVSGMRQHRTAHGGGNGL